MTRIQTAAVLAQMMDVVARWDLATPPFIDDALHATLTSLDRDATIAFRIGTAEPVPAGIQSADADLIEQS